MKTSDFYYDLPEELIAQTPIPQRDSSRLMTLNRSTGEVQHHIFHELPEFLRPGDCLILNDSRVIPARLIGQRLPGGGACEVLLLHQNADADNAVSSHTHGTDNVGFDHAHDADNTVSSHTHSVDHADAKHHTQEWECIVRPGRHMRPGTRVSFGNGTLTAEIIGMKDDGNRFVRFYYDGIFLETLEQLGKMPLPPYIHTELSDPERYQTVYAKVNGSAAAPTAGLHFTPELLERIQERGVKIGYVTLHVGLGTFRPVREADAAEHKMHEEFCTVPPETAELVNQTRSAGGRCICVGTTACRTLESYSDKSGILHAGSGWTGIYILPGYQFHVTDALITNFHLPESTLIMLVSAFAGRERILSAYREAVRERYRFFSFGDAMLLF